MRTMLTVTALAGSVLWSCTNGIGLNDMPTRTAKTICAKYYGCCMAAELKDHPMYGPDQSGCETKLGMSLSGTQGLTRDGEKKGRITYNGDVLAQCLDSYAKLSCEQLKSNATSVISACDNVTTPKVGVDGGCSQDNECIASSCQGAMLGVDGKCVALAAENGACAEASCGDGLYCRPGDSICQRTKADGQSCHGNFECATGGCNGVDPDAGTAGTCGLKGGPNTRCYATTGCSVGTGTVSGITAWLAVLALCHWRGSRRRTGQR